MCVSVEGVWGGCLILEFECGCKDEETLCVCVCVERGGCRCLILEFKCGCKDEETVRVCVCVCVSVHVCMEERRGVQMFDFGV